MKKFNISLVIPIFFMIVSILVSVFLSFNTFKYFIIMAVGAIFIIALCFAAMCMIVHYNMDLRHNFLVYIISVIISLILIIISYTVFDAFSSSVVMFGFPVVNIILMTLAFYFDKNRKEHEVLVWFLLNPNIYYIVIVICIGVIFTLYW